MKRKVTALVLSGGGNRGALQVGALQALFERGLRVDMLVGASAGALNAAFLAADPSPEQVARLADTWRRTHKKNVYPGNRLAMAWRVLRGKQSFFPNHHFLQHLLATMPPQLQRFGDLEHSRLYVVATHRLTGTLRVFGDDPQEKIIDALMASTAVPSLLPPWCLADECLVDGGLATNLPVSVALTRGATEIWAIEVGFDLERTGLSEDVFGQAGRAVTLALARQVDDEIRLLQQHSGHLIRVGGFEHLPVWDYSYTEEMIAGGYRQACQQLAFQSPERPSVWRQFISRIGFRAQNGKHVPPVVNPVANQEE